MKRVVLDTNIFIDWLNLGAHEELVVGRQSARFLSSVVEMELRAGATTRAAERALGQLVRAFEKCGRVLAPPPAVHAEAGRVLVGLRAAGREVRRASLVNDVLIALSARAIGATLCTRDGSDYEAIRALTRFKLEVVPGTSLRVRGAGT